MLGFNLKDKPMEVNPIDDYLFGDEWSESSEGSFDDEELRKKMD
jgi:hypothetical protein